MEKKCKYHCDFGDGEQCHYYGKADCVYNETRTMIDREKVIKGLELLKEFLGDGLPGHRIVFNSYIKIVNDAIALLKEQEQPTGHWIDYPDCLMYDGAYMEEHHVCSECSAVFSHMDNCMEDWKCCPNCGARMEAANIVVNFAKGADCDD